MTDTLGKEDRHTRTTKEMLLSQMAMVALKSVKVLETLVLWPKMVAKKKNNEGKHVNSNSREGFGKFLSSV